MNPKTNLEKYKAEIEPILHDFLKEKENKYKKLSPFIEFFLESLSEFTLRGGKRLRPALTYYTYLIFSNKNISNIKEISTHIELIQSFLLIHDDIMDHAITRRGGETIHKIFEKHAREKGFYDIYHFGNTMGILSGDLACLFAYEMINRSKLDYKYKSLLSHLVSEEITEVIFGQIHDILLSYQKDYSEEDILNVYKYKTAAYTFKLPIKTGALIGNATEEEVLNLEKYSTAAGIAFQIRDDILGIFGEDKTLGKEVYSDITEGKKTILTYYAYKNANKKQTKLLDNILGKKDLTNKEANIFKDIIKETKSLDYATSECAKYVKEAKKNIKDFKENEGTTFLNSIVDYIIVRDY